MNTTMPLATYVLLHRDLKDGELFFNSIYKLICRDTDKPMLDGMDIPVFIRKEGGSGIPEIDFSISQRTAVIILIDDNMCLCHIWRNYIKCIHNNLNENIMIIPVQLCKNAHSILPSGYSIQAINNSVYTYECCKDRIHNSILETLTRFIVARDKKITVFISHAKRDGETYAKSLKQHLQENTNINTFFDVNDILPGNQFNDQIKKMLINRY